MKSLTIKLSLAAFGLASLGGIVGCNDSTTTPPEHVPYTTIETWMGSGLAALGDLGKPPHDTDLYAVQDLTWGPDGRPYILDWNNHRILVVDHGVCQRLIGTGELGDGLPGPALDIQLNHPTGICFDRFGRLYLSAWHNSKVMRMDLSTGMIEDFAGTGARTFGGDEGPAVNAAINLPTNAAFDDLGNLLLVDQASYRIRMVDDAGIIHTVVGKGLSGFCGDEGPAGQACLRSPVGQAAYPAGRIAWHDGKLYIADTSNRRIRMVDENNMIHTVAGGGPVDASAPQENVPATQANLLFPCDVEFDSQGDMFIADTFNHVIRRVDRNTGLITTFAGQIGMAGDAGEGGPPTEALLDRPWGIAFDKDDNLYICDTYNNKIKVVRK